MKEATSLALQPRSLLQSPRQRALQEYSSNQAKYRFARLALFNFSRLFDKTSPSRSGKKQHEVSSIVFGDEQVPSSSITGSHRQRNPNANASSIVFDDSARQEASPKPSKKQFPHNQNNNDTSKLLHPPGAPPRQAPTPKKNKEHLWTTQSLGNFLNTETITRSPGQGGGKKIFASPPAAGKGLGSMSDLGGPLNEASPTREKKRIDPASVETIAGVRL